MSELTLARWSLILVWLWTAIASIWEAHGQSAMLLRTATALPSWAYPWLIWGGALTDAFIGLWMVFRPGPRVWQLAIAMTLTMTAVATWVDASLWLHPLGPLSKNLPILSLLWILKKKDAS
jgi:CBS-domain-containing membrane protein